MTEAARVSRSIRPWLPSWQRKPGSRLRLFCFPYAGGGTLIFRPWRGALPPEVELCPVQLPGREGRMREPAFDSMPALVEALSRALSPLLDLPFAFFGHSMGALVGFELARLLRRKGLPEPCHLIVSGADAPHLGRSEPPVHLLDDEALIERVREMKGTRDGVFENRELVRLFLPLLRADFAAYERYIFHPEPPLGAPITAFTGADDPYASPEGVAAWRIHTTGAFRTEVLPGDHFFIDRHPSLLVGTLRQSLRQTLHGLPR